jgi:hypothetical protein
MVMVRVCNAMIIFVMLAASAAMAADDKYRREIEQDRRETDEFLRSG